ncbi:MAG TPA: beta-ketoacyl-[acyl-carrier-protein] synthase family protein [Kineosporiaceae bacterium]|nr:beta-ketoacyl-[acyl-carrier-protein] synthase family protein [Kineosporiaceae bacterium]
MRREAVRFAEVEPVVVTGIGVVLPGTVTVHDFWANLRDGRPQISRLRHLDLAGAPIRVAGQLGPFDHRPFLPELSDAHAKKYSREILATMCAVENARTDAAIAGQVDPERIGFIDSSSRGPIEWWDNAYRADLGAPAAVTQTVSGEPMMAGLPGAAATFAAIYSGLRGMVTTLSAACVGGNHALSIATRELQCGNADAMLVGGHEFPLTAPILALYSSPGRSVLSRSEDPASAMRPYDRRRDGFVMGEGAVVLCLERRAFAEARGARCYADLLGYRHFNEAAHPAHMDLTGQATADLVTGLLQSVDRSAQDVGYVCGHGTGTRYNDVAESRAMGLVFDARGLSRPPLGSVKPIYGHLLGGAGILNVAATALMLHHQILCPTVNCDDPDPECGPDHVTGGPRRSDLEVAVSLSFALGSQCSAVALGRAG